MVISAATEAKLMTDYRRKTFLLILLNSVLILNRSRKNYTIHLNPQYDKHTDDAYSRYGFNELNCFLTVLLNLLPIITLICPTKRTRWPLLSMIVWNCISIIELFENSLNLIVSIYDLQMKWQMFSCLILIQVFMTYLLVTVTIELVLFYEYLKFK